MRPATVDAALEAVIRRDRVVVAAALVVVIALSWSYLLAGAGMDMSALAACMEDMAMEAPAAWTPGYAILMFLMWCVMMVAMMLPSAAPTILLVAAISRRQRDEGHPYVAAGVFATGHLAAWAGFSVVAVLLQWRLQQANMLSPMLVGSNAIFGALVLLAAGIYQLTPIKHGCLRRCRSPLAFLGTHWRPGALGALRTGLLHGAVCVGCCWALMALMFFGGVMNLYWMAGLAVLVLFEKIVPAGHWLGYATGVVLLVSGGAMLVSTF